MIRSSLRPTYATSAVAFLSELGADRVRHGTRTLMDHLVGTAAILERWGAEDDVCRAGLFHSIYGTEVFRTAVLPFTARPRVTDVIGPRAERLAYVFCAFDRRSLHATLARGAPHAVELRGEARAEPVTAGELADLVWLLWSNEIEQIPAGASLAPAARERAARSVARCASILPARATDEVRAAFGVGEPATV